MRKIIFICSLEHSGSTILNLFLGQHSKIIPIGEVSNSSAKLKKFDKHKRICACGKCLDDCEYWGKVIRKNEQNPPTSAEMEYEHLLNVFSEIYDDSMIICDESKQIASLAHLKARADVQLKVIYLIKDIRSYLTSQSYKSQKKLGRKLSFSAHLNAAQSWYNSNKKILRFLDEQKLSYIQLGYEEFCLYPDETTRLVFDFLNLEPPVNTAMLEKENCHIAFGNRMRRNPVKSARLYYDNRWFRNTTSHIVYAAMPWAKRLNEAVTYSNDFEKMWKS